MGAVTGISIFMDSSVARRWPASTISPAFTCTPMIMPIMGARTHGAWLGSTVFDGARTFEGVSPDLDLHMQRIDGPEDASTDSEPPAAG